MLQANVSEAISHLSDAIVACGVLPLIARFRPQPPPTCPDPAALLACYSAFASEAAHFGPAEQLILRELGLARLVDPAWWAALVLAANAPEFPLAMRAELAELQTKLHFAADTLPHLLPSAAPRRTEAGMASLEIVLLAQGHSPSHPLRLAYAIEGVCALWNVVCDMAGTRAPLAVRSCVAERDMAITFAGPAPRMAELKAVLMQVWDRVIIGHAASLDERIAAIPRALPVMERIGTGTQAAFAQRRDLETGVRRFLEAGACIRDMDDPGRFTPGRLLQVCASLRTADIRTVKPDAQWAEARPLPRVGQARAG